ncbi:hypothetical protein PVAND_014926 [Polypedilum vanderplanki]|nr:hypothetical protein PVAND_014926 [Polypedilum vanderplanki]
MEAKNYGFFFNYDWRSIEEQKEIAPFLLSTPKVNEKSQISLEFQNNGKHQLMKPNQPTVFDQVLENIQIAPHLNEVDLMDTSEQAQPDDVIQNILAAGEQLIFVPDELNHEALVQITEQQLKIYFKSFIFDTTDGKFVCAMKAYSNVKGKGTLGSVIAKNTHIKRKIDNFIEFAYIRDNLTADNRNILKVDENLSLTIETLLSLRFEEYGEQIVMMDYKEIWEPHKFAEDFRLYMSSRNIFLFTDVIIDNLPDRNIPLQAKDSEIINLDDDDDQNFANKEANNDEEFFSFFNDDDRAELNEELAKLSDNEEEDDTAADNDNDSDNNDSDDDENDDPGNLVAVKGAIDPKTIQLLDNHEEI